MADIAITNVDKITALASSSYVYVNSGSEIKQILSTDFLNEIVPKNAGARNAFYDETTIANKASLSTARKNGIKAGTFDGIFVGQTLIGTYARYYVAGCDYWRRCGDSDFTTHHLVLIPDYYTWGTSVMEETNITTNGYYNSYMKQTTLAESSDTSTIYGMIAADMATFGLTLTSHKSYLTTASSNGRPQTGSWYATKIDLMNENMCYGKQFSPVSDGTNIPSNYTIDKTVLPIFQLNPQKLIYLNSGGSRMWYWLRDIVSATLFAGVHTYGYCHCDFASNACGVRPAICVSVS